MLAPLALHARRMLPEADILFELDSGSGIPDIVLVRLREHASDRADTSLLTEPADIRVVLSLANRPYGLSASDLAVGLGTSESHLRRTVLPRLRAGGHIHFEDMSWHASYEFRSLAEQIITIEAKVSRWRSAVAQAARHALVADQAWVALDQQSTNAALRNSHYFSAYNIGLLGISTLGNVETLIQPTLTTPLSHARELLAERAVALVKSGRRSGAIPLVFGRPLTSTKGPDPRLADALGH